MFVPAEFWMNTYTVPAAPVPTLLIARVTQDCVPPAFCVALYMIGSDHCGLPVCGVARNAHRIDHPAPFGGPMFDGFVWSISSPAAKCAAGSAVHCNTGPGTPANAPDAEFDTGDAPGVTEATAQSPDQDCTGLR